MTFPIYSPAGSPMGSPQVKPHRTGMFNNRRFSKTRAPRWLPWLIAISPIQMAIWDIPYSGYSGLVHPSPSISAETATKLHQNEVACQLNPKLNEISVVVSILFSLLRCLMFLGTICPKQFIHHDGLSIQGGPNLIIDHHFRQTNWLSMVAKPLFLDKPK